MTRPKFSVGEEVILCTQSYPQINGQSHTVLEVIDRKEAERRNGLPYRSYNKEQRDCFWFYVLDGLEFMCGRIKTNIMGEGGLRKKHTTGKSFDELMGELNKPNIKQLEK